MTKYTPFVPFGSRQRARQGSSTISLLCAVIAMLPLLTHAPTSRAADKPKVSSAAGLLEVYRAAQTNDPTIRQAAAEQQAQDEAIPQARALLLPNIGASATLDQTYYNDPPIPGGDNSLTGHSIGINLAQPIYNRGNQVRQRQAKTTVQRASSDYVSAQQDLILRVAQRYFEQLSASDDVTFAKADKAAIARQLEQAKERFEVGLVTITDVQEAQARFDQSTATEISALNILADRKEALREITNQYYEQLKTLQDKVPLKLPDPADPEEWVKRALGNNPDLQSAAFIADFAKENIELQRSDYYPTLDLTANVGEFDSGNNDNSTAQIGLQFNVPIYTGGAISSRVREAAFQHEAAKEQRDQVQRAIIRQVQDAYRGAETAVSRVNALDRTRVSSRSALDATQAGFEVGTRTIVDVLNSQRDLLLVERDYAQSRYDYVLNRLALEQAAGDLGEEDLEAIENWLRAP